MPNRVLLNKEEIIEQIYEGDQTYESVKLVVKDVEKFIAQLKRQKRRVLILTDLTKFGQASYGSRKAGFEALAKLNYDKVGIFGASSFIKHLSNAVAFAADVSHKVKNFDTENEALAWLKKEEKR